MTKAKWIFLLFAVISSCSSIILLSVAFATDDWVTAEAKYLSNGTDVKNSLINYGLFRGKLQKQILISPLIYDLTIVCKVDLNKCMYSCHKDPKDITDDLENILQGSELKNCPLTTTFNGKSSGQKITTSKVQGDGESAPIGFINAGLLIATYVFLSIAEFFALISLVFATLCIFYSSPYGIFNVFGLYVWNGLATLFISMTIILYGVLFGVSIQKNIAIADTLNAPASYSSEGLATMGYSYWILFAPLILHMANCAFIKYRSILINRSEPTPIIQIDKSDTNLMVY